MAFRLMRWDSDNIKLITEFLGDQFGARWCAGDEDHPDFGCYRVIVGSGNISQYRKPAIIQFFLGFPMILMVNCT